MSTSQQTGKLLDQPSNDNSYTNVEQQANTLQSKLQISKKVKIISIILITLAVIAVTIAIIDLSINSSTSTSKSNPIDNDNAQINANQPITKQSESSNCDPKNGVRCGTSWVDANDKCGMCCVDHLDCTIIGESCYKDLRTNVFCAALPVISGCGTGKRVSLTFDDGPAEQNEATLAIINILNEYDIKATFYVSPASWGDDDWSLSARCALISELVASGHEIQSHSWKHEDYTTLSNAEIIADLNTVADFIMDCGAKYPILFRPPYGKLTKQQAELIATEGYIIGLWNLDSNDWRTPNDLEILNNIDLNVFNGDSINILMHDRNVYGVLDYIIEIFEDNDYEFVTQSECYSQCDTMTEPNGICWDEHGQNLWILTEWINK